MSGYNAHYLPRLCGECAAFQRDRPGRDPRPRDPCGRRPGWCVRLAERVARTSWCQLPEELEKQQAAMKEYRIYSPTGRIYGPRHGGRKL